MVFIKNFKLGATENFPRGKADQHDEGELRMALAVDHENAIVRMVFGKRIEWIGLASGDARQLLHEATEAAISDGLLIKFLMEKVGLTIEAAGSALLDFRELRQGSRGVVFIQ